MKRLQKERTPPPHPHTQKKKWSKEIREQTSLIASASVSNSLKNLDCRPAAKKQFKQISGVIFSHMEESFIKRKAHFVQMHCTNISNRQRRWRSSPMKLLMNMMVVSSWCVCVYICWTPSSIKDLTVSTSCMHEIKAAAKWVKKDPPARQVDKMRDAEKRKRRLNLLRRMRRPMLSRQLCAVF